MSRLRAKTPRFFRVVRNIGLGLAAVGTALISAPVALPAAVVTVATYLITAGAVAGAVSQFAKSEE